MMAEDLFQRLKRAGKLPTPPIVVVRILELTRRRDVTVQTIADTIAMDPALAARILKFANSPLVALPRQVTSLKQAASLLGMRGISSLALSFSVLSSPGGRGCRRFHQPTFCVQSLACGVAARVIARVLGTCPPEEAFVGGLLSQMGRGALACAMPEAYDEVLAAAERIPADLPPLERAAFGETYATIGSKLIEDWGLPAALTDAFRSFRDLDGAAEGKPTLPYILNVSETIAAIVCPEPERAIPAIETLFDTMHAWFDMDREQCRSAMSEITEHVEDVHRAMALPKGNMRPVADIEAEVRECMAELSVAAQLESQALAQQRDDLQRRATTDRLTGIANRAGFDERLATEIERAVRGRRPLTLLMIDVDRFKRVNDLYGHVAGDEVLRGIAATLGDAVRKIDFVARYGGEEFAVVGPETGPEGAPAFAERIRSLVEQRTVRCDGRSLGVTISVGAVVFTKLTRHDTAGDIVREADAQLYAAKRAGRNCCQVCVDGKVTVRAQPVAQGQA